MGGRYSARAAVASVDAMAGDARRTGHRGRRRGREPRPDGRPAARLTGAALCVVRPRPGGLDALAADDRRAIDTDVVDLLDPVATTHVGGRARRAARGRVDGLVHLVGGWRGGTPIEDAPLEDWDFLSALLVRTVQNATQAFAPPLMASGRGRFVLVSAGRRRRRRTRTRRTRPRRPPPRAWTLALADRFKRHAARPRTSSSSGRS